MNELAIIQKTYDLIKWYVPILNRLPRDHKRKKKGQDLRKITKNQALSGRVLY
ncbi:four helix bundle protein [Argonema antarcticum A004/B2]|nr:four helix bundle protein [Argonema antarcticum A004/B2]